jgi:hypothetical protein
VRGEIENVAAQFQFHPDKASPRGTERNFQPSFRPFSRRSGRLRDPIVLVSEGRERFLLPLQPAGGAKSVQSLQSTASLGYVFDHASRHAASRFQGLEAVFDPGTRRLIGELGVGPGWTCLEVGAGRRATARETREEPPRTAAPLRLVRTARKIDVFQDEPDQRFLSGRSCLGEDSRQMSFQRCH